jgi:hypothetical protein
VVEVPTITLDQFIYRDHHPAPAFVKIDVEGGEWAVLVGAQRMLAESRPVVVVEVRPMTTGRMINELMVATGYRGRVLAGNADLTDVLFIPEASGAQ